MQGHGQLWYVRRQYEGKDVYWRSSDGAKKSCRVSRTQLPLLPAYALTVHRCQSLTVAGELHVDLDSLFGLHSEKINQLLRLRLSQVQSQPLLERKR